MKINDPQSNHEQTAFLFSVDIMVEGNTNAIAMEKLLHVLNEAGFQDFTLRSGVNTGLKIQALGQLAQRVAQLEQQLAANKAAAGARPAGEGTRTALGSQPSTPPAAAPVKTSAAAQEMPSAYTFFAERMRRVIEDKRLIRLKVNRGHGVMLSIPSRVLSYDEQQQTITIYHVDEKQVYTFKWTEIEDFIV